MLDIRVSQHVIRVNPLIEFISVEKCIIFASLIPLKFCMRSGRIMYNERANGQEILF